MKRLVLAALALHASACSFVLGSTTQKTVAPAVFDTVATVALTSAALAFASHQCTASQNDLGGSLGCALDDSISKTMAAMSVLAALPFGASAYYGYWQHADGSTELASDLSAYALARAETGDCSQAAQAAAELDQIDHSEFVRLNVSPGTLACRREACATFRERVFDRARAAATDADRMDVLRGLPRCDD